eukprot:TRINITY_DN11111_c0_g2_i2.p1 TRINITY_DN11111_c0_g2~~TRINITY_DN11111_c0_g2_i2.p1  ORF type:complete len:312 (+),score=17.38 TRINITY_DN11111_c0_g2_i2:90-938(+)
MQNNYVFLPLQVLGQFNTGKTDPNIQRQNSLQNQQQSQVRRLDSDETIAFAIPQSIPQFVMVNIHQSAPVPLNLLKVAFISDQNESVIEAELIGHQQSSDLNVEMHKGSIYACMFRVMGSQLQNDVEIGKIRIDWARQSQDDSISSTQQTVGSIVSFPKISVVKPQISCHLCSPQTIVRGSQFQVELIIQNHMEVEVECDISVGERSESFLFSGNKVQTERILPLRKESLSWNLVAYQAGWQVLPSVKLWCAAYDASLFVHGTHVMVLPAQTMQQAQQVSAQ